MLKFLKAALLTGLPSPRSPARHSPRTRRPARKCSRSAAACHAVGEGAKHKVGPELNDVIGRQAGTAEGFKYSKAMIEAGEGGMVWDDEALASIWPRRRKLFRRQRWRLPA
jgi:cytochrome c2